MKSALLSKKSQIISNFKKIHLLTVERFPKTDIFLEKTQISNVYIYKTKMI